MTAASLPSGRPKRRPTVQAALASACRHPSLGVAAVIALLALLVAFAGGWLSPFDPFEQNLLARNQGPSASFLLGTDQFGRDVLSRLLLGTRLSLAVGVGGALLALLLGGAVGLIAVAIGGWVDYLVFGLVDLVRSMPGVLLALLLIVALGAGLVPVMVALGLTFAPVFARVARSVYLRENGADYVAVARSFGSGRLHMLRVHILPNVIGAFVTQAGIILPRCIVTESVLSFLGLGAEPDTPTWGRMIAQASRFFETNPVAVLAPIITLSLVTVSLAILSDRLRVRLDPLRHRSRNA